MHNNKQPSFYTTCLFATIYLLIKIHKNPVLKGRFSGLIRVFGNWLTGFWKYESGQCAPESKFNFDFLILIFV